MRARNLKPMFFKNCDLADAGPYAQLLFAGLWCMADREGRLKDEPRYIKAEIFPYYDVDVNGELTKLERLDLIRRYSSLGVKVIEVVNFKKHQSPHHTEKESDLPSVSDLSPCINGAHVINGKLTVNSPKSNGGNPSDSLIPDSLIPDSLTPASAGRGSKKSKRSDQPDWLEKFKAAYPSRAGTQDWHGACSAANARLKEGHKPDEFIDGAVRYAKYVEAVGSKGTKYVKTAAAFLGPSKFFTEDWTPPAEPAKADPYAGSV